MQKIGLGLSLLIATLTSSHAAEQHVAELSKSILQDTILHGTREETAVNPSFESRLENAFATHRYVGVIAELERRAQGDKPNLDDLVTLTRIYADSKGDVYDIDKLGYYLYRTAERGHTEFQNVIGFGYLNGSSAPKITKDESKALYWFKRSANADDAEGQFWLAEMHKNGWGTAVDVEKALYWYTKSATNGYLYSNVEIGLLYQYGEGIPQDLTRAFEFLYIAATGGIPAAYELVGHYLYYGHGTKQDRKHAKLWLEKSLPYGGNSARWLLGVIHLTGSAGTTDFRLGQTYINQAAAAGVTEAQQYLRSGCLPESLEVFAIPLACSDRQTINEKIVAAGGIRKNHSDQSRDIDVYDASRLLNGATTLTVTYLNDVFASAEYTVNNDSLKKLAPALSAKYNRPFSTANNSPQNVAGIDVYLRETPLGMGRLKYTNPVVFNKLNQQSAVNDAQALEDYSNNF
ncbi:SEL1-like repeat protein [Vibrio sp. SCSIO 43140]|uniref:tetratricopeptide repeat protein n=1 Tax=Vibrio sp. SCSIO 43140 TaxID=2819100 RepID=UPI0020763F92|nr:hypothetical protein [Vibrio sp. SCSIO 43140]USD58897.1 SEL1-like repeat protein [Vibrio sp. SCSIO 43140]